MRAPATLLGPATLHGPATVHDPTWQAEGHEWVGLFVARMFGKRTAVGRIKKWVPADGEDGA